MSSPTLSSPRVTFDELVAYRSAPSQQPIYSEESTVKKIMNFAKSIFDKITNFCIGFCSGVVAFMFYTAYQPSPSIAYSFDAEGYVAGSVITGLVFGVAFAFFNQNNSSSANGQRVN